MTDLHSLLQSSLCSATGNRHFVTLRCGHILLHKFLRDVEAKRQYTQENEFL
jgi:hypothetical protein